LIKPFKLLRSDKGLYASIGAMIGRDLLNACPAEGSRNATIRVASVGPGQLNR